MGLLSKLKTHQFEYLHKFHHLDHLHLLLLDFEQASVVKCDEPVISSFVNSVPLKTVTQ